jgi:discoidin domain receptor family protein 2
VLGLVEPTPSPKLGGSSSEPLRLAVARIPSSGYPEELSDTAAHGNGGRDALREVRFLASLADPNIARVLGLVRDAEPSRPWTIIEYTELGDLAHYLQYSEPLVGTQRPSCTLNFIR